MPATAVISRSGTATTPRMTTRGGRSDASSAATTRSFVRRTLARLPVGADHADARVERRDHAGDEIRATAAHRGDAMGDRGWPRITRAG